MLQIRFTGLIFGLLLVMHALESFSVHAHQGEKTNAERLASAQKEVANGIGGRKMGGHALDGTASKNSGANRSDGKCDFEEKGVKCKSWNESNSLAPRVEPAEFVAFGADYRGPKRHPPKHN
ncbi:hypothetical protein COLO4_10645 [Corchorus olitorius]|uniref:Uncharacterized protein n=1 Tax=Corchorus olitorius TaxID=93759 RepID=A0A1R3K7H0_9ROSI|nr:hypothetical protein COLO4_10645 [Corchorus olitorius]